MTVYRHGGKRLMDLAIAVPLALVLTPLCLVVGIVVLLGLGRPVLFTQVRPGLHGRPFRIYKFRTMTNARDHAGVLLPDQDRLTRLGNLIRSTSLDEVPQLWNVVRGDMSLVGPRPLLMAYLHRYSAEQARRHEVRPGVTGWTQVNGRNAIGWPARLTQDVWYVEHCSLRLDLKIIWLTVRTVLARTGINEPRQATVSEFRGDRA